MNEELIEPNTVKTTNQGKKENPMTGVSTAQKFEKLQLRRKLFPQVSQEKHITTDFEKTEIMKLEYFHTGFIKSSLFHTTSADLKKITSLRIKNEEKRCFTSSSPSSWAIASSHITLGSSPFMKNLRRSFCNFGSQRFHTFIPFSEPLF